MSPNWLHFDEGMDVLASLELFNELGEDALTSPYKLKWAIIALHSATTGAIVCELSGSMQIGPLTEKAAKATIRYFDENSKSQLPKQYLAPPKLLVARLVGSKKRTERTTQIISIPTEWVTHYEWLTDFRNSFTHFAPRSWSIETGGLPTTFVNCLLVIRTIKSGGWAFRHLEEADQRKLDQLLSHAISVWQDTQ